MKKITLLIIMSLTLSVSAQNNKIKKVNFYGVDFSMTKVMGSKESPRKFTDAFYGMNNLFVSEPNKYNVAYYSNYQIAETDLEQAIDRVTNIKLSSLYGHKPHKLTDGDIKSIVEAYKPIDKERSAGYGLLIIAVELNKTAGMGTYRYVVFDELNKDIVLQKTVQGKAGGLGLRNYWAGSLLESMKAFSKRND